MFSLQWRHNEHDCVSNHQRLDCLINHFFQAQIKQNIKAPRHWPLWGEFTGHRWILRTKGQWHGKMFPFDDVIMESIDSDTETLCWDTVYCVQYALWTFISSWWVDVTHCSYFSMTVYVTTLQDNGKSANTNPRLNATKRELCPYLDLLQTPLLNHKCDCETP